MTQVFTDDGIVERVTVLEAGPCPVTGIRTNERDGYAAVQLAFGATKEKHLSKAELGHLRQAAAPPMKHVFTDDGIVERVTVLEAGPCPVTGIRANERDGYEAVELGFGATKEKPLSKAELGQLRKADAQPMKHVVEFRDEAGELLVGE